MEVRELHNLTSQSQGALGKGICRRWHSIDLGRQPCLPVSGECSLGPTHVATLCPQQQVAKAQAWGRHCRPLIPRLQASLHASSIPGVHSSEPTSGSQSNFSCCGQSSGPTLASQAQEVHCRLGLGSLGTRGSMSSSRERPVLVTRLCMASRWCCLALLYSRTPAVTRMVPMADRLVTLLPKMRMLSQMDRACFAVLATLQQRQA